MDTASAMLDCSASDEYGCVSVRVEASPNEELFERVGRLESAQETVYEYIPPEKTVSIGSGGEPETEHIPISWEAWGDCEDDEDDKDGDHRRARVDRLQRDIEELRLMMNAHRQRLRSESATSDTRNRGDDGLELCMEQLDMTLAAEDGQDPTGGTRKLESTDFADIASATECESGALWRRMMAYERMETLERKVCMMESGLGRVVGGIGGEGLRAPILALLEDLSRQVSIIETKRAPADEEVTAAIASLDLLLDKQAQLETTMHITVKGISAVDNLYTMCLKGETMKAEVAAVADCLRVMRSYEGQAEFLETTLDDIEAQQRRMTDILRDLRSEQQCRD